MARQAAKRDAGMVSNLLSSENGKILMRMLETELSPVDLMGSDAQQTGYKLGRRDAYLYILELIKAGEQT